MVSQQPPGNFKPSIFQWKSVHIASKFCALFVSFPKHTCTFYQYIFEKCARQKFSSISHRSARVCTWECTNKRCFKNNRLRVHTVHSSVLLGTFDWNSFCYDWNKCTNWHEHSVHTACNPCLNMSLCAHWELHLHLLTVQLEWWTSTSTMQMACWKPSLKCTY